ncbi:MAG: YggS family pyridoxal phosphate-dependent enzyme [Aeromicrobium sp.]|nr:MAG: YggS family pyridoxal phosphate-dependent enzyme [Aeromicrobium sp.]
MSNERRAELARNLERVETQIAEACEQAQRPRKDITLIAVTKTYPASDVDLLAELGVADVGENRHPEAGRKRAECQAQVRWHFIGGLQTNKASVVAAYADVVHSVDRRKLVAALDRGAAGVDRVLDCLIQVDFDTTNPGRAGVAPSGVAEITEIIAASDNLRLAGVMTVAPLGVDPEPAFAQLRDISALLCETHPEANIISSGMSEDFALAIKHGATHLRIGRSILGNR